MKKFNSVFSLAGGLLFLVRNGAGDLSLDNRRSTAAIST